MKSPGMENRPQDVSGAAAALSIRAAADRPGLGSSADLSRPVLVLCGLGDAGRRSSVLGLADVVGRALGGLGGVWPAGVDPELLERLAAGWAGLEPGAYGETLRALMRHDATALVPGITVPALVIA